MAIAIRDYTKVRRAAKPGTLIGVRLQPEALVGLDRWIAGQNDQPSRPEAIRRLIELGLKAAGPASSRKRVG